MEEIFVLNELIGKNRSTEQPHGVFIIDQTNEGSKYVAKILDGKIAGISDSRDYVIINSKKIGDKKLIYDMFFLKIIEQRYNFIYIITSKTNPYKELYNKLDQYKIWNIFVTPAKIIKDLSFVEIFDDMINISKQLKKVEVTNITVDTEIIPKEFQISLIPEPTPLISSHSFSQDNPSLAGGKTYKYKYIKYKKMYVKLKKSL